jgi:hypothetical protein
LDEPSLDASFSSSSERASSSSSSSSSSSKSPLGKDRCLNPSCQAPFEIRFASASFECYRLVSVGRDKTRRHLGYVCDGICAEQFLTWITERNRIVASLKRKRDAINAPSPQPTTSARPRKRLRV